MDLGPLKVFIADQDHPGSGITENEREVPVVFPRVQRHDARAHRPCGEVLDDNIAMVIRHRGDAVPPVDAGGGQIHCGPATLFVELAVG